VPAAAIDLGDLSITIPAGCVIAAAELAGARLLLRLDGLAERGCQQVILIGLDDGSVDARITARPEGAAQ